MKIKDVPEEYKIYVFKLSNREEFLVNGIGKKNIMKSQSNFIELDNGNGFNKAFIVSWSVDTEATRQNVFKNRKEIKSLMDKNE